MISFLSIIALGFFLGMRHATDPDHVIAVTTIVTRQPKLAHAALIGAFWGIGHTLTIFLVGTAIILFNLVIPARLGLGMELTVAFMLILLGLINVAGFARSMPDRLAGTRPERVVHAHTHSHGDYIHSHPHAHAPESHTHSPGQTPLGALDRALAGISGYQHFRPFVVGIVHGLAGSAAVALLVLAVIRDSHWAIAYLLVFGVGTIAGMMVITLAIASALKVVGRGERIARRLALASGVLSLVFGLVVAYQICAVHGLFSARPWWTAQ